ncbi:TrmH family RNA methyltransferase [Chitinophaga lutea]
MRMTSSSLALEIIGYGGDPLRWGCLAECRNSCRFDPMLSKAQIKYIQSLQHKKNRQKSGHFVAEGDKIVQELMRSGKGVKAVYASAEWLASQSIPAGVQAEAVSPDALKQLSSLSTPNQAIALADIPQWPPLRPEGAVTLALDTIQDPGNMGTLIRIADWFGIRQIVCSPESADAWNTKTIQATMGSFLRVPVHVQPIPDFLDAWPSVSSYAATLHGDDITRIAAPIREGIILIGNESRGLSDAAMSRATHRITIPRIGHAESLNAAVAAGIICGRLLI